MCKPKVLLPSDPLVSKPTGNDLFLEFFHKHVSKVVVSIASKPVNRSRCAFRAVCRTIGDIILGRLRAAQLVQASILFGVLSLDLVREEVVG